MSPSADDPGAQAGDTADSNSAGACTGNGSDDGDGHDDGMSNEDAEDAEDENDRELIRRLTASNNMLKQELGKFKAALTESLAVTPSPVDYSSPSSAVEPAVDRSRVTLITRTPGCTQI